jgi:hypothetical protein
MCESIPIRRGHLGVRGTCVCNGTLGTELSRQRLFAKDIAAGNISAAPSEEGRAVEKGYSEEW